jgi:archaemetzincin
LNKEPLTVGLLPIGRIPGAALDRLAMRIRSLLGVETRILDPMPNPEEAYDERRNQYNAATLLTALDAVRFDPCDKVIALLNVDLFIPIFTHVLGEAREGGRYALASLFRLRRNADGSTPPMEHILERLEKVAVHELGHTFNLGHCMEENCVMHFSGGLKDLDGLSLHYCTYCAAYLQEARRKLLRKRNPEPQHT